MKNNFFLFLILCSLFSCWRQKTTSEPAQENAKYSHNFTKLFAMKIKDKYNLTMDASGGSYYILMASFEAPFSCKKNQTRKLLFQCADECLKMMNADPKIKTIKRKKSADSITKSEWTKKSISTIQTLNLSSDSKMIKKNMILQISILLLFRKRA